MNVRDFITGRLWKFCHFPMTQQQKIWPPTSVFIYFLYSSVNISGGVPCIAGKQVAWYRRLTARHAMSVKLLSTAVTSCTTNLQQIKWSSEGCSWSTTRRLSYRCRQLEFGTKFQNEVGLYPIFLPITKFSSTQCGICGRKPWENCWICQTNLKTNLKRTVCWEKNCEHFKHQVFSFFQKPKTYKNYFVNPAAKTANSCTDPVGGWFS